MSHLRATAATLIAELLQENGSLSSLLEQASLNSKDRPWIQALCFEVMRGYPLFAGLVNPLLDKPLKARDQDVYALLLIGICQLERMRVADHAAINETVNACTALHKGWAKGLVNAVLRNYQRRRDALHQQLSPAAASAHPDWLWQRIRSDWPQQAEAILHSNNQHPPLGLRVNRRRIERAAYLQQLQAAGLEARSCEHAPDGLWLTQPVPVSQLPGFSEGLVSVQDESAQLAASLLPLAPGLRVLDACAAPGGKTAHLLEIEPELQLTALDISEPRLKRVRDNLQRLNLKADVLTGDLGFPGDWWDGELFDRILLDAPCSGTGVIRRHPDIKLLRRPQTIAEQVEEQAELLRSAWGLLKPGGVLLYATCSILPEENAELVQAFLQETPDAREEPISADWGLPVEPGRQILPSETGGDGFYFSRLKKLIY